MRSAAVAVAMALAAGSAHTSTRAGTDAEVGRVVAQAVQAILPADDAGGAAVAVRTGGRTLFFTYGFADAAERRPVTPDSLFNLASLRKVFETTLLARAVLSGEIALDDPVGRYVTELHPEADIGRVTFRELATHASGLLLPQDHPPWPEQHYTLPAFFETLNAWQAEPGRRHLYTHAGFVLLQLALERRFARPIAALIEERVTRPLGLASTVLPPRGPDGRAMLPPALLSRAVQGYGETGAPIGLPGDQQGYYDFPGTGQMFSSARDLAAFVAANLGEAPADEALAAAMAFARRGLFAISPRNDQALAWEINRNFTPAIVEKNGGMNNSSTYLGLVPERRLGVVVLSNRGEQVSGDVGRRILSELASR